MGMLRTEAEALFILLQVFGDESQQREHRLRDIIALRPDLSVRNLGIPV